MGEDRELMQLDTFLKGSPGLRALFIVPLSIDTSPRVRLVHFSHDTIPLGLWLTGQQIAKELIGTRYYFDVLLLSL